MYGCADAHACVCLFPGHLDRWQRLLLSYFRPYIPITTCCCCCACCEHLLMTSFCSFRRPCSGVGFCFVSSSSHSARTLSPSLGHTPDTLSSSSFLFCFVVPETPSLAVAPFLCVRGRYAPRPPSPLSLKRERGRRSLLPVSKTHKMRRLVARGVRACVYVCLYVHVS